MRSMVVFLSVVALAAASPSGLLSYGAVVGVAPVAASAVSHQERVDIKSTPTVVETKVVQPIARTVVAQPALVAPSYVAPLTYSAPLAYSAPLTYAAPVAVAPAAVSHQSRVDIKSTPAVVSTVATAPIFRTVIPSPISYATPIGIPAILNSGIAPVAIAGASTIVKAAEIPTEVSAELPVAPSETAEVAAARAAHLEAKAEIEKAHSIEKRSVILPAPVITTSYAAPITKFASTPIFYSGAHLHTYPSPIVRIY